MKKENLEVAIFEAKRFLLKAEELNSTGTNSINYYSGSKITGSVKRSSMDLTRALAELRKVD